MATASPANGRAAVGTFDLVERIGRGPRSEVWSARNRGTGQAAAVKLFNPELTRVPNFVTLFEKETLALASMTHPNIVTAHSRGTDGGRYYLVQDLLRGASLNDVVRQGPIGTARVVALARSVCEALDYSHRRSSVHGHLTAENVFIDATGTVRVSDFGLSLLSGPRSGDRAGFDVASDLAELAELVYKLLAGSDLSSPYTPPAGRYCDSPKLDAILRRALDANPNARFKRASELGLALALVNDGGDAALGDLSSSADPPASSVGPSVSFTSHNQRLGIAIRPKATAIQLKNAIRQLEAAIGRGGPYQLAYDLGELATLEPELEEVLYAFHRKPQPRIARVAACSPRPIVRARILRLGTSCPGPPWKVFAATDAMLGWLEREQP